MIHMLVSVLILAFAPCCICQGLIPYSDGFGDSSVVLADNEVFTLDLPNPFTFYGTSYNKIYFTDNGIISFSPYSATTTNGKMPSDYPALIAVYFSDFAGSTIYYRHSTSVTDITHVDLYVATLFPSLVPFTATSVTVVTWFGFRLSGLSSPTYTFQAVLVSSNKVPVVMFLYEKIDLAYGSVLVGVNAGDGVHFEELDQSLTAAVADLETSIQTTLPGVFGFLVNVTKEVPDPTSGNMSAICITNKSNSNMVDVTVYHVTSSGLAYGLQALNTSSFNTGIRLEATGESCRGQVSASPTNLTFTVNISNTNDPGCGTTYTNGFINITVEAVEQFGFYRNNDTVFRVSCNILPSVVNVTYRAGDIAHTTVPSVSGKSLELFFSDRYTASDAQKFQPMDTVQLGRYIYPIICFNRGQNYTANVNIYGIYGYSCQLSNNENFYSSGENATMDLVLSNGCLASNTLLTRTSKHLHAFTPISSSTTPTNPFCIGVGGFHAFRWRQGDGKLYMSCFVGFCRNTQLYMNSKCRDSCRNTIIDTNTTDPDDSEPVIRSRRDVNTENHVETVASVTVLGKEVPSVSKFTQNNECVDITTATVVIFSLSISAVIAVCITICLSVMLQRTRMVQANPVYENMDSSSVARKGRLDTFPNILRR